MSPVLAMYSHCFSCNAPFPRANVVEHFPVGRRIAYDMERGRLWAICEACGGWTLAPIEQRFEALEELEELVTNRGGRRPRLAGRTENITLFKVGSAAIIRVGRPNLLEEAAWRYGKASDDGARAARANPFAPRRLGLGETLLGSAYLIRSRMGGKKAAHRKGAMRRWVRYGEIAWRGERACEACGFVLRRLTYFDCRIMILKDSGEDGLTPSLVRACPRCKDEAGGGLHLEGTDAEFVLRRVLAYQHDGGTSQGHLEAAAQLIEQGGGAVGLSSVLARYGRYLGELPVTSSVALRVIANEAYEQRMLGLEATALERRWREEEELASIIDGELTDVSALEGLRLRLRGG